MLYFEKKLKKQGNDLIIGVDEAGRGPLAGPVVAAAVVLPSVVDYVAASWLHEVTDSKQLVASVRERLAPQIMKWALSAAIGLATVEEINQINIFHASHLAMIRAIAALDIQPEHLLIDGKFLPKKGLNAPASAIIKGDLKCLSIACASIIAKVWRDQQMDSLCVWECSGRFGPLVFFRGYPVFVLSPWRSSGTTTR